MLGRYIALVALMCFSVVVFVPRGGSSDSARGDDGMAPSQSPPAASADWYAGAHTLERQRDGHFYAHAYVNGTRMRMLVDTGASVVALTGPDATAAGLHWSDNQVRAIGQGASGEVYGVPTRLEEVEIGGIMRRNVAAVIVPDGLPISLLGQSYLGQISSVEIDGGSMRLGGE